MATVSEELVERVAHAIEEDITRRINDLFDNAEPKLPPDKEWVNGEGKAIARAVIEALSTPEFARAILDGLSDEERAKVVMPLAEKMLRGVRAQRLRLESLPTGNAFAVIEKDTGEKFDGGTRGDTLLDTYIEAKGELTKDAPESNARPFNLYEAGREGFLQAKLEPAAVFDEADERMVRPEDVAPPVTERDDEDSKTTWQG